MNFIVRPPRIRIKVIRMSGAIASPNMFWGNQEGIGQWTTWLVYHCAFRENSIRIQDSWRGKMVRKHRQDPAHVLSIILAGGAGKRLFPLTKDRSKPAVPLGGKYRLIDIPISNCINSGLKRIFVLTQFNSASLNRHISNTYRFDPFAEGFIEVLAAEQTMTIPKLFQGKDEPVYHH